MAIFEEKAYLSEADLRLYDKLIKEYIDHANEKDQNSVAELLETLTNLSATVTANANALEVLNGNAQTDGSIAKQVSDAVAAIVDGAPEALDTLKELADWVSADETASATLINKVDENTKAIDDLKVYVDAQNDALYNSIKPISESAIVGLFPIKQDDENAI